MASTQHLSKRDLDRGITCCDLHLTVSPRDKKYLKQRVLDLGLTGGMSEFVRRMLDVDRRQIARTASER